MTKHITHDEAEMCIERARLTYVQRYRDEALLILHNYVVQQRATTDWQPIETAPKDGTRILAWNSGWEQPTIAHWYSYPGGSNNRWDNDDGVELCPTHWMHLPPGPSNA